MASALVNNPDVGSKRKSVVGGGQLIGIEHFPARSAAGVLIPSSIASSDLTPSFEGAGCRLR